MLAKEYTCEIFFSLKLHYPQTEYAEGILNHTRKSKPRFHKILDFMVLVNHMNIFPRMMYL